jgi:hypothetical protein
MQTPSNACIQAQLFTRDKRSRPIQRGIFRLEYDRLRYEYDRLRYAPTPRREGIEPPVRAIRSDPKGGSAAFLAQVHEVIRPNVEALRAQATADKQTRQRFRQCPAPWGWHGAAPKRCQCGVARADRAPKGGWPRFGADVALPNPAPRLAIDGVTSRNHAVPWFTTYCQSRRTFPQVTFVLHCESLA